MSLTEAAGGQAFGGALSKPLHTFPGIRAAPGTQKPSVHVSLLILTTHLRWET